MALITAGILFLLGVLAAALSQQLTDEFKAWMPWIVRRLIQRAVARLPEDQRERYEEEWQSHIDEVPGEIGKIYVVIGFLLAARRMTSILKTQQEHHLALEALNRAFDLALSAFAILAMGPLLSLITVSLWVGRSRGIIFDVQEIQIQNCGQGGSVSVEDKPRSDAVFS